LETLWAWLVRAKTRQNNAGITDFNIAILIWDFNGRKISLYPSTFSVSACKMFRSCRACRIECTFTNEIHSYRVSTPIVGNGEPGQSMETSSVSIKNTCESFFEYDFMRTHLLYQFNSFHIMDYADEELLGMNNRFAIVILAAQKALKSNKLSAFQLADHRLAIARTIIQNKQYSIEQIRYLLYFLKTFIRIESKEINLKFDKEIETITGTEKAMTIIEAIKYVTREEALEEGQAKVISSIFRKTAYTPEQIADITELDLDFILEIKADMEDGNLKSPSES